VSSCFVYDYIDSESCELTNDIEDVILANPMSIVFYSLANAVVALCAASRTTALRLFTASEITAMSALALYCGALAASSAKRSDTAFAIDSASLSSTCAS